MAQEHRLLKNTVSDQLGLRGYCLYTRSAWDRLGLREVTTLVAHDEDAPDFGVVEGFVQDLVDVYRPGDDAGITLDASDLLMSLEADIPMSPPVVWDYLSSPVYSSILVGSQRQEVNLSTVASEWAASTSVITTTG